jgi:hypothetical protein
MSFAEFTKLCLTIPPDTRGVIGEFARFLRSGCTEVEAKRWLAAHIWDFPEDMRKQITMSLAADAMHTSAVQTEEELQREFMAIWKREGFAAAQRWYAKQRVEHGGRQ